MTESSTTAETWIERMSGWRASGERADAFSRRGGTRRARCGGGPPSSSESSRARRPLRLRRPLRGCGSRGLCVSGRCRPRCRPRRQQRRVVAASRWRLRRRDSGSPSRPARTARPWRRCYADTNAIARRRKESGLIMQSGTCTPGNATMAAAASSATTGWQTSCAAAPPTVPRSSSSGRASRRRHRHRHLCRFRGLRLHPCGRHVIEPTNPNRVRVGPASR